MELLRSKENTEYILSDVVKSLVNVGMKKKAVIQELLTLLQIEDADHISQVRVAAVNALVDLRVREKKIIEKLLALLHDGNGGVQGAAIKGLISLDVKEKMVIEELLALLKSGDMWVQLAAIRVLTGLRVNEKEVIQEFLTLLKHENSFVQSAVKDGLIILGVKENDVVLELLTLLDSKDFFTTNTALEILIGLEVKEEAVIQKFLSWLKHKSFSARQNAIKGLIGLRVEKEAVVQELFAWLKNESSYEHGVALKALVTLGVKEELVIKEVLALLKDGNSMVRAAAVKALIDLRTEPELFMQELLALLKVEDRSIRGDAIKQLIDLGEKNEVVIKELSALLKVEDKYVKAAAIKGLLELGVEDKWGDLFFDLFVLLRRLDMDSYNAAMGVLLNLNLSEQAWFNILAQWEKVVWPVIPKTHLSAFLYLVPPQVLLRLWTEGRNQVLEYIVFKLQSYPAYWHEGYLYYHQEQLEKFPLTQKQYALLYRAFRKTFPKCESYEPARDLKGTAKFPSLIQSAVKRVQKYREDKLIKKFIQAALKGDIDSLQALLKEGVDVNVKDLRQTQATALHYAAFTGNPNTVKCLLGAGADPLIMNDNGETAIDWAKQGENPEEIVRLLEERLIKRRSAYFSTSEEEADSTKLQAASTYTNILSAQLEDVKQEKYAEESVLSGEAIPKSQQEDEIQIKKEQEYIQAEDTEFESVRDEEESDDEIMHYRKT